MNDQNETLFRRRTRYTLRRGDELSLLEALGSKIIGQPNATSAIAPYVNLHQSGLAPEGRPIGVFLLLGPTGTGKTRTVEALAEVLHGNARNLLRIDCGEFQMEHEVAKLIGAPPGYLGHRETHPLLSQSKVNSVASERSNVSIVLFDEIEKAAPTLQRLLLAILDKATLRLGDNNTVNFERCFIFLTSNLGAQNMMKEMGPAFGFSGTSKLEAQGGQRLESLALAAAKRHFSPEFINRVDAVITYKPLSEDTLRQIVDLQLLDLQRHIGTRLGDRAFVLHVPNRTRQFLLREGTSAQYGAREIKRAIHKHLMQPLAALVARGAVMPGTRVTAVLNESENRVTLRAA